MKPKIEISEQHQVTDLTQYTGKGINIAVMDACFNLDHPAIKPALSESSLWYSGDDQTSQKRASFYVDYSYHGNHCLGLIGGIHHETGQPLGLATAATLIPVCGINSAMISGTKRDAYYNALNYLKTLDCHIINLSQAFLFEEEALKILIELVEQGKIICYAAGNDANCLDASDHHSSITLQHPVLRKGLLVVGNLNTNNRPYSGYKSTVGSNFVTANFNGNFIWVRGDNRYSAIGTGYDYRTGTSMAAPTLAGAIALLWEQNPHFCNEEIVNIVMNSGSCIKGGSFPILNVANMLSLETQQRILSEPTKKRTTFAELSQKKFPEIEFELSGFIFSKLSDEALSNYYDSDCSSFLVQETSLIKTAEYYALYGLFQIVNQQKILIMPIIAIQKERVLLFLKGRCLFIFSNIELFLNDLAYSLSQHLSLGDYDTVYCNWGKFEQEVWENKKVYNLSQPKLYYQYRHAKMKSFDHFPDFCIVKEEVNSLITDDFLNIKKIPSTQLHSFLMQNPNKENYIYATSAYYHTYVVQFKDFSFYLNVLMPKKNQIIIQYKDNLNLERYWFDLCLLLQAFQQKATVLGFEVFLSKEKGCGFSLPFSAIELNDEFQEEMEMCHKGLTLFSLDKLDIAAEIGTRFSTEIAFLDLIKQGKINAVRFYLDQGLDINNMINPTFGSALFLALRFNPSMTLIQCLVEAGINIKARNREGLTVIRFAEKLDLNEIAVYLKKKVNPNQNLEQSAEMGRPGIQIEFR